MPDSWTDRLSDYLEGDLRGRERAALEAHLASCAECAETLAGLRAVVARARTLPERAPATNLWPGIAARLEPRRSAPGLPARRFGGWRVSFTVPQLAAAALALTLLSSGTMWLIMDRRPVPAPLPATGGAPVASSPSAALAPSPSASRVPSAAEATVADFGFVRYEPAMADLERVLAQHRAH